MSLRASDHQDDSAAIELSFTGIETGARPKLYNRCDMGDMELDSGGQPPGLINGTDWSVVNDWCREHKQDSEM
jgi:hypothetical protein